MQPTLLTIAGFDPSSGAGITADLAVMLAHGFFGISAITALTVQSTVGVRELHPVSAGLLRASLDCLAEDLPPAGIKVGMLATRQNVDAVSTFLAELDPGLPLVVDPVLRSSSGAELLEPDGVEALERLLSDRAAQHARVWITPNLAELAVLARCPVETPGDMEGAAARLWARWPGIGIVATGGHLALPRDLVLSPLGEPTWLDGVHLESRATHGTGCAFSTALLCGLVSGLSGLEAARSAKHFVAEGIRCAETRGAGRGPLDLIWPLRSHVLDPAREANPK